MKRARLTTFSLIMILLGFGIWFSSSRSQAERASKSWQTETSSSQPSLARGWTPLRPDLPAKQDQWFRGEQQTLSTPRDSQMGANSTEEHLIRDVYARLMRYQSAAVDQFATSQQETGPADYVTFEVRQIHTGPISEIYPIEVSQLSTPRTGDFLNVQPNYVADAGGIAHAYYEVAWVNEAADSDASDQSIGKKGFWKDLDRARFDDSDRPIERSHPGGRTTVRQFLSQGGARFSDAQRYASYQVTVRLSEKQHTYQALVLFRSANGSELTAYTTEQERLSALSRVEILDNVTAQVNTVLNDVAPAVRSPWEQYSMSALSVGVSMSITAAKAADRPLIPAAGPVGYLPGDDVVPTTREMQKLAAAAVCPGSISIHCSGAHCGIPISNPQGPSVGANMPYANTSTVTATVSPGGGTFTWSISSNKAVIAGQTNSSTSSTVTIRSVSKSDSPGDVILHFTYSLASDPVDIPMTVQQPTTLRYLSTPVNEVLPPFYDKQRLVAGWVKRVLWQVYDHLGQTMTFRMPLWDSINRVTTNCRNPKKGEGTELSEHVGTSEGGEWNHRYRQYGPSCLRNRDCRSDDYQEYTVNGFVLSNDRKDIVYGCKCIAVEGDGSTCNPGSPAAPKKTAEFVDFFWLGTMDSIAPDADYQAWTISLNNAQAQGAPALLAQARSLGRYLFYSSEYVSLNRTNEEFVADLYYAYLQREPDTGGYNFWLSVLQNDIAQGQNGKEHLILAFEGCPEFSDLVNSLEAIAPEEEP